MAKIAEVQLAEVQRRNIVISGASGGLGRALVKFYAAPGVSFLLFGRDLQRLVECAEIAASKSAFVRYVSCSGDERRLIESTIASFDREYPIDLLVCAAGTKTGNASGIEDVGRLCAVIDTNLIFPMLMTGCVLEGMRKRNTGQIALVSSIAAVAPHPDLLSYSASKAGLNAYGTSLRRALVDTNISVSVIMPGFVDTAMTQNHRGPTPFLVTADYAAHRIRRGLMKNQKFISFPTRLRALVGLWNLLPTALADRISIFIRANVIDPELLKDGTYSADTNAEIASSTSNSE